MEKTRGKTMENSLEKIGKGIKKNIGKALGIGAFALASFLPMSQKVSAQTPSEAYRYVANFQVQQNDSTDNYHGSGNIVNPQNRYEINQEDVDRLDDVINGSFSDPDDKRLLARCDINGNGVPDIQDKNLLQAYVNKTIPYLPGQWNRLPTRAEQESWFQKMVNLSKIDETCDNPAPGYTCDCDQFSTQARINLMGLSKKELELELKNYPYDTTKNGLYNIPLLEYSGAFIDLNVRHAMNGVYMGDLPDYSNLCLYEPQSNAINVELLGPLYGVKNADMEIRGSPESVDGITPSSIYINYEIRNNIPTITYVKEDGGTAGIKFVKKRESNSPIINITNPIQGATYTSSLQVIVNVSDETIFDMFRYIGDYSNHQKEYYPSGEVWASIDSGKTKVPIFKYTNRTLDEIFGKAMPSGKYDLWINARDGFEKEAIKKIQFTYTKQSGIEDRINNSNVLFYPNPVKKGNGISKLSYEKNKTAYVEIYDLSGRRMSPQIKDDDGNGETSVNFSEFNSGMYMYTVRDDSGKLYAGKVVVE